REGSLHARRGLPAHGQAHRIVARGQEEVRPARSTSQRAIGETGTRMKVVMLGATRGIGRSLARLLATGGTKIHVLGRNADDLAKCAEDLKVRGAAAVSTGLCDLMAPATFAPALDAADATLGGFDTVILSAGVFGTQDE